MFPGRITPSDNIFEVSISKKLSQGSLIDPKISIPISYFQFSMNTDGIDISAWNAKDSVNYDSSVLVQIN